MNKNKWIIGAALSVLVGATEVATGQLHQSPTAGLVSRCSAPLVSWCSVPATPAFKAKLREMYRLDQAAAAAMDAGQYAEAEDDARQSMSLGHDPGVAQELLASALDAQGKTQEALEVYQQMADVGEDKPRNMLPYALLSLKAGHWAQAVTAYNKQLPFLADGDLIHASSHFSPDVPQPKELETAIHIGLGLTEDWRRYNSNLDFREQTLTQFQQAVALEPASPLANLYYGYALQRLGRKAEAQAAFAKAAKTGNEYVEADAEEEMNWPFHSKEQILARFQQAAAQNPNSSLANLYYGRALARLGRVEAQAALTKAAKIENEECRAAEEAEEKEIRQRQPR